MKRLQRIARVKLTRKRTLANIDRLERELGIIPTRKRTTTSPPEDPTREYRERFAAYWRVEQEKEIARRRKREAKPFRLQGSDLIWIPGLLIILLIVTGVTPNEALVVAGIFLLFFCFLWGWAGL